MNNGCSNGEKLNIQQVTVNQERPQRLTLYAALSILLAAFAGLWQYGFSIGIINSASVPVKKAIKEHYEGRYGEELSLDEENAIWVVISASFPVGGVIGSLLVNSVVRRFGRLQSLVYGHIFTILLSLLLGISGPIKSPEAIILGRIGIGITTSIVGTGITVMYIAEISPRRLRGFFGAMITTAAILGVTASNILGLPSVLGAEQLWPLLFTLTCLPSLVFVAFSKILPESPRKLYIENKDIEAATRTLRNLRGIHDVSSELEDMDKEAEHLIWNKQITVAQLVRSTHLRRQIMCAVCLSISYHLTGIDSVAYSMNNIYLTAGIPLDVVLYCTIGVWAAYFVYQLCINIFIEKCGRRKLLIAGYSVIAVCHALLTMSIETQHTSDIMPYVSVAACMCFLLGFGFGPGPVTLVMVAECFDQTARSAAMTLSNVLLWVCMTVVVLGTPYALATIGGYTFLVEGAVSVAMVIWGYFFLPETRNRCFSEIQVSFHKQKYGHEANAGFVVENCAATFPM